VRDEHDDTIAAAASTALLLALTLFLFGPTYLYFTNILEFSSPFRKLFPLFLGLSVLCSLVLTGGLALLKTASREKAVSLLLTTAFLLWLQGNVLVWQYGPLDGRAIDWSASWAHGVVDSLVWLVFLIAAYFGAGHIYGIAKRAAFAFIIIQMVSTSVVVIRAPSAAHLHTKLIEDEDFMFAFSPERNVLILVLDTFQGDIFQEIIRENPTWKSVLDGFTYYRNALGGYPTTYASVPLILTGCFYENNVPIQEFIKRVFLSNSLPRLLKEQGYQVDIIGGKQAVYADEQIATNWCQTKHLTEDDVGGEEALFILDITFFRYLPHFAKQWVYNEQKWRFSNLGRGRDASDFPAGNHRNSIATIRKMARRARLKSDRPVFRYIHLDPPHYPLIINERLEYEELENTRYGFKRQAQGTLKLAGILLDKLKELGIYDETMVFVVADHGARYPVNIAASGYEEGQNSDIPMLGTIKSSALPLVLVKPFDSRGEMAVSDAPVSLADIAKTVASALGVTSEIPGSSLLNMSSSDVRSRRYLYHEWGRGEWPDYLPPMREYLVAGFSWLDEAWHPTHNLYTPEGIERLLSETYHYGEIITFGTNGNYLPYQGWGWSYPQSGFTWTNRTSATLVIPLAQTQADVELRATFMPFLVPDKLEKQQVKIIANNTYLASWTVTENAVQEWKMTIPNDVISMSDTLSVTFLLNDAVSPASLKVDEDTRVLGLAMRSVVLTELIPAAGSG
jgi:hypothetical protein